jgi:uncharacterized protein YbcI
MTDETAQDRGPEHESTRRHDGAQLAEISNTMVQLQKQFFGKGPTKARTSWAGDDALICIMGGGFTPVEQTLYESGREEAVLAMRKAFQQAMEDRMRTVIEKIVERKVVAFMSTAHQAPDLAVEIFVLEPQPEDSESPVRAENQVSPGEM